MTPVVLINLFTDPKIALFSLIYLLVVQQVEVAFIEPKVVGGQLGLSPFLTILAVTVGGGFFIALFSLIYLLVVQQVEVAFIEPKVVGGQLGLSPFLTILAVTVGGGFFGIPGMILSTPIMGVLKVYITEYVEKKSQEIQMSNFDNPREQE